MIKTLGKTLKQYRRANNITLKDVEKKTGISNAYLSQLENDKIAHPSADTLYKLSLTYGVELETLLSVDCVIKKDLSFTEHFNKWWWGYTFTLIVGKGLGTVEVQLDNNYPSIAFIKGLSVLEPERMKGLGSELMEHCILIAIREQKQFLQLSVDKRKGWLIEWYQRLGFITIMSDEHEFTMLKALGRDNNE